MFAIAFELTVADAKAYHPTGVSQAYTDIGNTLARYDYRHAQAPGGGRSTPGGEPWPELGDDRALARGVSRCPALQREEVRTVTATRTVIQVGVRSRWRGCP